MPTAKSTPNKISTLSHVLSATVSKSFQEIENSWFIVSNETPEIIAECGGDKQKIKHAMEYYVATRTAYYSAIRKIFDDNSAMSIQIRDELADSTKILQAELATTKNIVRIIEIMGVVAKLAATLAGLGAIA